MSLRNEFQVRIIQKLGAPLLTAAARDASADSHALAERTAELMNRSVQLSIEIGRTMDLKDNTEDGDSLRVALAAISSGLIGGLYGQSGRVPDEAEQKKLLPALESVLSFADKFAPATNTMVRLDTLDAGLPAADENQLGLQYIQALGPVVSEIAAFSFGRPDRKLAQEVAERLANESGRLRRELFGDGADESTHRRIELGLLSALAGLYADCHRAEKKRLMELDDKSREAADATPSLDPLWQNFETRVTMLAVLSGAIAGNANGQAGGRAPAASAPPPAQTAPQAAAPQATETVTASADAEAQPVNPMSFFRPGTKAPPSDTGDTSA